MKTPKLVEFHNQCDLILCHSLLSVNPEEGCALLIGEQKEPNNDETGRVLQIKFIWPCCNVWGDERMNLFKREKNTNQSKNSTESKANRFAIDAQEQIVAQRWAREHKWEVLGSAHSHPSSNNTPSIIDLKFNFKPSLMVIVDRFNRIGAWWLRDNQTFRQIKVAFELQQ